MKIRAVESCQDRERGIPSRHSQPGAPDLQGKEGGWVGLSATRRLTIFQQILADEAEPEALGPPKVDNPDDFE
ncbi:MAG: hypothetical protein GQ562_06205 [Anaerolineales bacterium]|nr:hypothetical protein [Anaerolineales bacterium]